ncbi:hypothetical protein [Streptomyces sp. NPDC101178]|uniref:hypothetical protein n=1 Tax=Streptomyces sp. NPDC101178 TaxID=3366124 RepID=UPI003822D730
MTEIEVPGPEPDWQPATQLPYDTDKNPAHQFSVRERSVPLFQMIGVLALPVQPVAQRLRLIVERSWDGVDAVTFRGDAHKDAERRTRAARDDSPPDEAADTHGHQARAAQDG